jgi:microcystin-dependent protein
VAATLDESDYADLDKSFSTEDLINEAVIKFLRYNDATGETEEVTYGPYRNETSISEWGVRTAEFTVQGLSEETSDIPDLAAAILAANADPVVRTNSLVLPVPEVADIGEKATLDIYDAVDVTHGLDTDTLRVTSLEHIIEPTKWMVSLKFGSDGQVAAPTFVPSPQTGAGGLTIGQLLRPVGEVTMWYGAKASIPAGWLPLDGTTVASMAADYPDLYALLGSTTLPDFTDKFPIGAGTKALGSTGGAATKGLVEANVPRHTHSGGTFNVASSSASGSTAARVARGTATAAADITPISGQSGTGTGLSDPPTPVDILNPYRALWFVIRAR